MPVRKRRSACNTVLLLGEGKTDAAFLRHIKSLYISRGCGVSATIRNARGKGPDHVVNFTIRQRDNAAYNRIVVLLDSDLPMSAAVQKRASRSRVHIIGSTPCIVGLLLKILGKHVPATSATCKEQCGGTVPERLTFPEDYREHFPRDLLDSKRGEVPELCELLDCLSFDDG